MVSCISPNADKNRLQTRRAIWGGWRTLGSGRSGNGDRRLLFCALLLGLIASMASSVATAATTRVAAKGNKLESQRDLGQTVRPANSRVLQVGPTRSILNLAAAAQLARDGDTIEVDAGDYVADVAVWTQNDLTIRGVGGRPRLLAAGKSAQGKAIWVMNGRNLLVDNFEFRQASVPDKNGAGIRLEKGSLTVRNCRFIENQNGILTANNPQIELAVENSEFGYNGAGDGQSHNIYVGAIARLSMTASYSHHARVGHLLKSRAAQNLIYYNRLTDETAGRASYELEFPNGGMAYVVGNIIQQGSQTENPHVISFGAEGYKWPQNQLYLVNNTLIDDRPSAGRFLRVKTGGRVLAVNNLLVGKNDLASAGQGEYRNNYNVDWDVFKQANRQDYRLLKSRLPHWEITQLPEFQAQQLMPTKEYVHPLQTRALSAAPTYPGALQTVLP